MPASIVLFSVLFSGFAFRYYVEDMRYCLVLLEYVLFSVLFLNWPTNTHKTQETCRPNTVSQGRLNLDTIPARGAQTIDRTGVGLFLSWCRSVKYICIV